MIKYRINNTSLRQNCVLYAADVDGTICYDSVYNTEFALFEPNSGLLSDLLILVFQNPFILVTNQSGINRHFFDTEKYFAYIYKVCLYLEIEHGVVVSAIYICPHLAEADCLCRKPRPGMLIQAMSDYKEIANAQAIVFWGNSDSDQQAFVHSSLGGFYNAVNF